MRQVIALGGGGFSTEPDNPLLDLYVLNQSTKKNPKICFIPTASGDEEDYIADFYKCFERYPCQISHLSLFKPPVRDLESFLLEKDIIYVGGGSTRNLLVLWKAWGLDTILKKGYDQGVLLAGLSAGANCWFEEGVTGSYGDELEPITCLGIVKGSNCPHYDEEAKRRPAFQKFVANNQMTSGVGIDDGVAIHYIDGQMKRIVSSRPNAKAYQVYFNGELHEEELKPEYLGDHQHTIMNQKVTNNFIG